MALVPPPGRKVRPESREQLTRSIELLKELVGKLDVDELLRKWSGPPLSSFRKTKGRRPGPSRDAADAAIAEWLSDRGDSFHAFDMVEELSSLAPESVLKKIWEMEAKGILRSD